MHKQDVKQIKVRNNRGPFFVQYSLVGKSPSDPVKTWLTGPVLVLIEWVRISKTNNRPGCEPESLAPN